MKATRPSLLLVDDDKDDCLFFKEALDELPVVARLTIVHDGEELMQQLSKKPIELPDIIFLDLNMARKNGFECLSEIKSNERLKQIAVIVFSTTFEQNMVNLLYEKGAQYFIRKPAGFLELKKVIYQALLLATEDNMGQPSKENFVIKGDLEAIQL